MSDSVQFDRSPDGLCHDFLLLAAPRNCPSRCHKDKATCTLPINPVTGNVGVGISKQICPPVLHIFCPSDRRIGGLDYTK